MITIRNKRTGEVKTVPRSQFVEEEPENGASGILQDVKHSLSTAPEALGEMVASIPGGINRAGYYATTNNPLKTGMNLGLGAAESGAALLSSPQVLARYLSGKFPGLGSMMERGKFEGKGINDPTLFEDLSEAESEAGFEPNEEEQSVRSLGGLLSGAGVLRKIPSMFGRTGTLAAEQGGRGGDPLHAAILGLLGEGATKIPYRRAKDLPNALVDTLQSVPEKAKSIIPELKANMGETIGAPMSAAFKDVPKNVAKATSEASIEALKSAAETAAKYHVPYLPRKLMTKAATLKYKTDPETYAKEELFKDLEHEDLEHLDEREAAGKLLELNYNTIGELLDSPFESAKQGDVGRTPKGRKLLNKLGKGRLLSEEASINKTLNDIYNEHTLSPEKNEAYRNTMEARVPEEFVQKWSADPVVKKAMQELQHESAYEKSLGKNPDKGSFRYWDHIKKIIGDMESGTEKVKGTKKFKKSVYTGTRNEMVGEMDVIHPEYASARRISEREHIKNDIERYFNTRKKSGNNFYKFLSDTQKFDTLMERLEGLPIAQEKLRAWKKIGEGLIPEHVSNRTAKALQQTSMTKSRNQVDAIEKELDILHGQKHDVAKVKLITNPELPRLIREHLMKEKGNP